MSIQLALVLASGSEKPSFTNVFSSRSNSLTTHASAPPRDIETRQRLNPGLSHSAPCHTQFSPSNAHRASRSSTVSQVGCALRYSAGDVRRQIPRGLFASFQKL